MAARSRSRGLHLQFRSFAGAAVVVYWGALIGASVTKSMFWHLHLLWMYSVVGATVWALFERDDCRDRVALWILILGPLLPPIVTVVILLTRPPPFHDSPCGSGLALLFAFVWCGVAAMQVLSMAVAAWVLQGIARWPARTTDLAGSRDE